MDGAVRPARRLDPAERRERIIAAAVCYFAEVGFAGTTRDLAQRAGVTQALLYRYFASKDELAEAVFERVFLDRLRPHWPGLLRDAAQPLEARMIRFYGEYTDAIFTYEWMRIFMWAGLAGEQLNRRYLTHVAERLLTPLRAAIAADGRFRAPDPEEIWALHGGIVYLGIRRFIYQLPTPADCRPAIERTIRGFLAGLGPPSRGGTARTTRGGAAKTISGGAAASSPSGPREAARRARAKPRP